MKLENSIEDQMDSSPFCYIKWVAVVVVSLVFAGFWSFGLLLSVIFTSIVLILSTLLFTFTKQKPAVLLQKSVTVEVSIKSDEHQEIMMMMRRRSSSPPSIEDVVPTPHKEEDDYSIRSSAPDLDLLSESESLQLDDHISTLSEEDSSEVDWRFQDIVYQSPDCSDGSISDEESLIEIALPSGHYVDHNKEEEEEESQKLNDVFQQKVPYNFLPLSTLKQHSLMELLAELNDMNEEDNLIEIDISMGSIKCSRFEIEA